MYITSNKIYVIILTLFGIVNYREKFRKGAEDFGA
jgi:hypothetical protein